MMLPSLRGLAAPALALALAPSLAQAQLAPYAEDFEGLVQADGAALANAGWLVFANVFNSGGGYLYGYGPFPAPNGGPGFCAIAAGEGGVDQGAQQIVAYSDYNNTDHAIGNLIEANTFQEQIVGPGDVGKTFTFTFDAKLGDIQPNSTSQAFIKIIDGTVFSLDGFQFLDTTNLPVTWGTYSLSITIEPQHVGDFFQVGFSNVSTNYTPSGIVYDNLSLAEDTGLGTNYCVGAVNSTGSGAVISASGSASIAANDLVLAAEPLPASQFGVFFYGPDQIQVPFGNGQRCVGGGATGIFRLPVTVADGSGVLTWAVDNTTPPGAAGQLTAGSTWNFQAWYRDPAGGGAAFNLSDGLELTFLP